MLDPLQMLPAPGQGALAVECRADVGDPSCAAALGALDDAPTRAAVTAERALLAALEAGCSAPVGALAEVVEGERRRRSCRCAPWSPRRTARACGDVRQRFRCLERCIPRGG